MPTSRLLKDLQLKLAVRSADKLSMAPKRMFVNCSNFFRIASAIAVTVSLASCTVDNRIKGTFGGSPQPDASIVSTNVSVNEGEETTLALVLGKAETSIYTVQWRVEDPHGRLVAASGVASVLPGQTSATLSIAAQANSLVDGNEVLALTIQSVHFTQTLDADITVVDKTKR